MAAPLLPLNPGFIVNYKTISETGNNGLQVNERVHIIAIDNLYNPHQMDCSQELCCRQISCIACLFGIVALFYLFKI